MPRSLSIKWGALAVALVLSIAGGPLAKAEDEDGAARRAFKIAVAHYENGEFLLAAQRFAQAYHLSEATPKPANLFYNLYLAYRDANEPALARDSLATYLKEGTEITNRDLLKARLADLVEKFGPVEPFDVAAAAEGRVPVRSKPGADGAAKPVGPSGDVPSARTAAVSARPGEPAPASTKPGPLFVPGIVVGGVGAASALVSIATGVVALRANRELTALCGANRQCSPDQVTAATTLSRRVALFAPMTDILLFGGLAVAAAGATLIILGLPGGSKESPKADTVSAAAICTPQGCFASMEGRF